MSTKFAGAGLLSAQVKAVVASVLVTPKHIQAIQNSVALEEGEFLDLSQWNTRVDDALAQLSIWKIGITQSGTVMQADNNDARIVRTAAQVMPLCGSLSQNMFTTQLDSMNFSSLLRNADDNAKKRLLSASGDIAGRWLEDACHDAQKGALDIDWTLALRMRLGLVVQDPELQCSRTKADGERCANELGYHGNHSLMCKSDHIFLQCMVTSQTSWHNVQKTLGTPRSENR